MTRSAGGRLPLVVVSLVVALGGAATATACSGYRAGSFEGTVGRFDGVRRTVGCLDVGITREIDPAASGPVAAFRFGNRCDAPVEVDLESVRARVRLGDGTEIRARPRDPQRQLRPVRLDARASGEEWLELEVPEGSVVMGVCLDVSRLDAAATAAVEPACLEEPR